MIRLYNNDTGEKIGEITDEQLQFLIDNLEEESLEDQDYYLQRGTVEMLAEKGADSRLLAVLRRAVGDREGVEIRWSRSSSGF
ncbi:MAG: galactosyldiacylglycerol synthase [candidate division Zixibacteria bacterium SM23_81]|nr:MAG: galactosyldiacylglycerol synthase [candidate division Zixibacteria bacterium SM23_81]